MRVEHSEGPAGEALPCPEVARGRLLGASGRAGAMVLPGQENFDDYAASEDSFGLGPPPTRRATKVAWNGGTKVRRSNLI